MSRYETLRRNEQNILKRTRSFLRENKFAISEKDNKPKSKPKSDTPITDPIAKAWNDFAAKATDKTRVFETIPIILALSDVSPEQMTLDKMISILNTDKDWDEKAKEWLTDLFNNMKNSPKKEKDALFKSFMTNVVYGQGESRPNAIITAGGASLKDLNGGPISDFIHGDIRKFYKLLAHIEGSKEFTADAIIFWGDESAASRILRGEIKIKDMIRDKKNADLLATKDGTIKMACVSLKAFVGKIGKITKYVVHTYSDGTMSIETDDEDTSEQIKMNEGIFDSIKSAFSKAVTWISNTKIYQKIKEWYEGFVEWAGDIVEKIETIFSPSNPAVSSGQSDYKKLQQKAEELLSEFDKQLEEHIQRNGILTESAGDEKIPISDCYYKLTKEWYGLFDADVKNYNKIFEDFGRQVESYKNNPKFKIQFQSLKTTNAGFVSWSESIKKLVDTDLESIKSRVGKKVSDKSNCKVLLQANNKPFYITRNQLKPMLMSNANFISIRVLKGMIDDCEKNVFNEKDADTAMSNLIKFSTKLNTEAVFGGVVDIPLVKYNGTTIESLGTRVEYEDRVVKKLSDTLKKDVDIPLVGIRIFPAQLKEKDDLFPTWYTVLMYSLADLDEQVEKGKDDTRPIKQKLLYNEIRYSCNSGSTFSFATEGTKRITGEELESYLKEPETETWPTDLGLRTGPTGIIGSR